MCQDLVNQRQGDSDSDVPRTLAPKSRSCAGVILFPRIPQTLGHSPLYSTARATISAKSFAEVKVMAAPSWPSTARARQFSKSKMVCSGATCFAVLWGYAR